MDTLKYKTKFVNKHTVQKRWLVVDAENQPLGRLASMVAFLLRGKHKPSYSPHVDCGDNVIVINAEKVKITGSKLLQKELVYYTGYPGGQRFNKINHLLKTKPTFVVEHAVRGMLPKNRLGRRIFKNLHVYIGPEHKHQAQQPIVINLNEIK
ncbi:MAG: 50S ribosomal protein L13 [Bacteroidales bacterium]|nr:50S ribosomal protein L13 [Bacteroidales bacterium]